MPFRDPRRRIRSLWDFAAESTVHEHASRLGALMKSILVSVILTGIAAIGGALAVYGSNDDSPGGTLLGILLVLGAMVFGARSAQRGQ